MLLPQSLVETGAIAHAAMPQRRRLQRRRRQVRRNGRPSGMLLLLRSTSVLLWLLAALVVIVVGNHQRGTPVVGVVSAIGWPLDRSHDYANISCDGRKYHPVTRRLRKQHNGNDTVNEKELELYRRVCRQRLLRNQVALAGKIFPFLDKLSNISPSIWVELWQDLDEMTDPEDLLLILLVGWALVPLMALLLNPLVAQGKLVAKGKRRRKRKNKNLTPLISTKPPKPYSETSFVVFPLLRLIRDAARLSLLIYIVDCVVIVLISLGVELVILDDERLTVVIAKMVYVVWGARLVQSVKTVIIHRIVTMQVRKERRELQEAEGEQDEKANKTRAPQKPKSKKRLSTSSSSLFSLTGEEKDKGKNKEDEGDDDDDESDDDDDTDEEEEDEDDEDDINAALDAKKAAKLIEGRCGVLNRLFDALLYTAVVFFLVDVLQLEMGVTLTSVFAFGSVSTLIFTLASRDMAGHLVNGLVISISSNVFEGDFVEFDNGSIVGRVEKLGWTETLIRNVNDKLMVVPNTLLVNKQICNLSRIKRCNVQQTLHISYDDISQIPALVQAIKQDILWEFDAAAAAAASAATGAFPSASVAPNAVQNNHNSLSSLASTSSSTQHHHHHHHKRRHRRITLVNEEGRSLRVEWTDYGPTSLIIKVDVHFHGIPPIGDAYFETRQRVLEAIRRAFTRLKVPFHVEPV